MDDHPAGRDLTEILNVRGGSDAPPPGELFRAHYDELRRLAGTLMRGERDGHTLQATALVHEAFVRLIDRDRITDRGSMFFKACIAQECRRVLVEHARARNADQRGGKLGKHALDDDEFRLGVNGGIDLLELHDLIEELYKRNESVARVVDLRVFGGLTIRECSEAMSVSPRSINKYWAFAQSWLKREMAR